MVRYLTGTLIFIKITFLTLNLAIKYVDEEPKRDEIFTEP